MSCKSSEACETLCFYCVNLTLPKTFIKHPSVVVYRSDFGRGHQAFDWRKEGGVRMFECVGTVSILQVPLTMLAKFMLWS